MFKYFSASIYFTLIVSLISCGGGDGTSPANNVTEPGFIDYKNENLTIGDVFTLTIKADGSLWSWGDDAYGQLGDGEFTIGPDSVPDRVGTDKWQAVTAGQLHTLAQHADGSLYTWGYNDGGMLGIGFSGNQSSPVQVSPDTDWIQIEAGGFQNFAIKSNGTLWAWGKNFGNILGMDLPLIQVDVDTPTQVGISKDWFQVSTSGSHTVAIKQNGTLWGWGPSLGIANLDSLKPTQIGADTDWLQVSAGEHNTLTIKKNGTLWGWGVNQAGELGNNDSTLVDVVTRIGSDSDWFYVSTGAFHSAAIKNDGTLWAWGVSTTIPQKIGTDKDWVMVSAGNHFVAMKEDGSIWTWGTNFSGQLGDGTTEPKSSPVKIY